MLYFSDRDHSTSWWAGSWEISLEGLEVSQERPRPPETLLTFYRLGCLRGRGRLDAARKLADPSNPSITIAETAGYGACSCVESASKLKASWHSSKDEKRIIVSMDNSYP